MVNFCIILLLFSDNRLRKAEICLHPFNFLQSCAVSNVRLPVPFFESYDISNLFATSGRPPVCLFFYDFYVMQCASFVDPMYLLYLMYKNACFVAFSRLLTRTKILPFELLDGGISVKPWWNPPLLFLWCIEWFFCIAVFDLTKVRVCVLNRLSHYFIVVQNQCCSQSSFQSQSNMCVD